jgi:hypothetical protein
MLRQWRGGRSRGGKEGRGNTRWVTPNILARPSHIASRGVTQPGSTPVAHYPQDGPWSDVTLGHAICLGVTVLSGRAPYHGVTKGVRSWKFRPCLAGLRKGLRLHAELCRTGCGVAAPAMELPMQPRTASTREVEPRKRGSTRLPRCGPAGT